MNAMEAFAANNNIVFNVETTDAADKTFEAIFSPFLKSIYSEREVIHRGTTKSFATVANLIMKNRKLNDGAVPMADDENDEGSSSSSSDDDSSEAPTPPPPPPPPPQANRHAVKPSGCYSYYTLLQPFFP